ncbi:MAG: hypothetical protein COV46_06695 [Deltaproteobacteria bacterium CG11_big_fil_rev_8_21_14_0_20_49_13]|nr:MAG: hypothetical protein COV46_06695 [Deltaproteobacteria bacterium CG11_big_fil_rev_8_21_14_0_20_49_13]
MVNALKTVTSVLQPIFSGGFQILKQQRLRLEPMNSTTVLTQSTLSICTNNGFILQIEAVRSRWPSYFKGLLYEATPILTKQGKHRGL